MLVRIFAFISIILSLIVNPKALLFIITPEIQIILGTLVVAVIAFGDAITGFFLGIAILLFYLRVYSVKYGISLFPFNITLNKNNDKYPMSNLVSRYVTPENLNDAQNNIVDKPSSEIKGFRGIYGERVYGAQGLDKNMPGFTNEFSPVDS